MPYIGEVLVVKQFIHDMTGHDLRDEVVKAALEKAEQYREREKERERS